MTDTASSRTTQLRVLALVGGVATVASTFLSWTYTSEFPGDLTVYGYPGGLQVLTLVAGLLTALFALSALDIKGLRWLTPTLIVICALASALLLVGTQRLRRAALVGSLALLLLAPATWAVQTLCHATSGTFPAGGPANGAASGLGGPGAGRRGGFAGGPPGGFAGLRPGAGPSGRSVGTPGTVPGVPAGAGPALFGNAAGGAPAPGGGAGP